MSGPESPGPESPAGPETPASPGTPGRARRLVLPFSLWLMKRTMLGNPYIQPWVDLNELGLQFEQTEFLFGSYYICRTVKP